MRPWCTILGFKMLLKKENKSYRKYRINPELVSNLGYEGTNSILKIINKYGIKIFL